MNNPLPIPDNDSAEFLDALFTAVTNEEGTLAGGDTEQLFEGGTAVQGLRETKITFGHPLHRLTRLTPALFTALGIELDPILKKQRRDYEFYSMTLAVSLSPKRGASFQRVECELQFGPDGLKAPIVETMFPQTKWHSVLSWGGGMNLALNGRLDWEIGLPDNEAVEAAKQVSGAPTAQLKNNNEMKAHIILPDYSFEMGRVETNAAGEGNTYCRWRIEDPQLQKTESANFVVVFKVPKEIKTIELSGIVTADTKMSWLTAQLNNVFGDLADHFQALWQPKARLPIGVKETWTLPLPE